MPVKIKSLYKTPLFRACVLGSLLLILSVALLNINPREDEPVSPLNPNPPAISTAPTHPEPPLNPLHPNDFAYREDYLTCLTVPTALGIDISEWQTNINWPQVKAAGIEFVMIRVGWRGSEKGVLAVDSQAQSHYEGASAAGLKVGAYFFSQAISPEEAAEEADFLLREIKHWKLDMPVVFDWEYLGADARTGNVDARTLTDCAKVFCSTVSATGHKPMLYFNISQSLDLLYLWELTDYQFWLAQYGNSLQYPYKVNMWQYTDAGAVPGINGAVDINLYFRWDEE